MSKGAKRRVDPLKKKLRKAEVVAFLTSNGAIKEGLANSLYEQGLDRWNKLTEGDENYFLSFRGVGLKTASVLMDLAREKKKDFETKEERSRRLSTVKEFLDDVPRLRGSATKEMIAIGFDSVEKISKAAPDELVNVKGVGPKLALVIIEHAKEALTTKPVEELTVIIEPPSTTPIIEEATGLSAEEAPKEESKPSAPSEQKGFFERFMGGLKRFFSPAKEEAPKEQPKEDLPPADVPPAAMDDIKEGEPDVKAKATETAEPQPGPVTVEAVPEDGPKEDAEPPVPEPSPEVQPAALNEAPKAETPPPEDKVQEKAPSFFQKLKGMVFGSPKEQAPAAPKVETIPTASDERAKEVTTSVPVSETAAAEGAVNGLERFEDIPGVDPAMAQKLRDSGYMNVAELREAIPDDLMMIEGITKEIAESICTAVKPQV